MRGYVLVWTRDPLPTVEAGELFEKIFEVLPEVGPETTSPGTDWQITVKVFDNPTNAAVREIEATIRGLPGVLATASTIKREVAAKK